VLRALLVQHGPARPLQFPSLEHLDDAIAQSIERARTVDVLQPSTTRWAGRKYNIFRRYLAGSPKGRRFVSGEVEAQVALLEAWIADLRQRGISRSAINSYWRGVLSAFRWLGRERGTLNPLLFAPHPRAGRQNPRVLTRQAAETIVSFVRNYPWRTALERTRNLTIVGLMLLAGLRRGETLKLHYGDVDVEAATIRIVAGKGPHGGTDRTAYMAPQLCEIVRAYQAARLAAGRTHPEFLSSLTGNAGISEGPVNRLFRFISRETGIAVNPHALRHTYATLLRQAGIPDRVSMELLGHSSLVMLQRYSHVFSDEPGRAADKLRLDIRI
jgi:integrase